MSERLFVACDIANLWKSCRQQHGLSARLNFTVLKDVVPTIYKDRDFEQELFAYLVTHPKGNHQEFVKLLEGLDFRVRERSLRYAPGVDGPIPLTWDVGITLDAMDRIDFYDTFVLIAGDSDFSQLFSYLRGFGKKTIVLTFETSIARVVFETADELFFLSKAVVYSV